MVFLMYVITMFLQSYLNMLKTIFLSLDGLVFHFLLEQIGINEHKDNYSIFRQTVQKTRYQDSIFFGLVQNKTHWFLD